jgi:hypothetical protein
MKVTKSKLVIFSLAVAFVSVFFFAYVVQAFYPAPEYDDFCSHIDNEVDADSESICELAGGKWTERPKINEGDLGGSCNLKFYCREDYNNADSSYERNIFSANLIIGIIVLIIAFFLSIEAISSGLMGGAVMLIVYGSIRYWEELDDVFRAFMLGVVLVILIWLGYRNLKE